MANFHAGAARWSLVYYLSHESSRGRYSKIKTDLSRDKGWDAVKNAGLQGVSLISIDDVWSAMRFRPAELYEKKD